MGGVDREWVTHTACETEQVGRSIAHLLRKDAVCLFCGDLGAGKTTLIKGLISELTGVDPSEISSPTFTYVTPYEDVRHFDLYRLAGPEEFCQLGLQEELESGLICCIEWPDRLGELTPSDAILITLAYREDGGRTIRWEGSDSATPAL